MRYGPTWLSVPVIVLGVAVSAWSAPLYPPREVSGASQPIWVRLLPDQITRLVLPDPLTEQDFAVPPSVATFKTNPSDPKQLIVVAKAPKGDTHMTVHTTRQTYVVVLRRADQRADSVITVTPPPDPPPPTHPKPSAEAAMRQFWQVQWWGRSDPPHIRYEPVEGFLVKSEGQQTEYVAYQCGLGFYGWTLKVTNTGTTAQVVDIEAMQDVSGRLLSILVQRTSWAE